MEMMSIDTALEVVSKVPPFSPGDGGVKSLTHFVNETTKANLALGLLASTMKKLMEATNQTMVSISQHDLLVAVHQEVIVEQDPTRYVYHLTFRDV